MDSLKFIEGYDEAIKWIKNENKQDKISYPRLSTPVSTLKQVEDHFLEKRKLDLKTLNLYENLCSVSKYEILLFLCSCEDKTTEEKYYEVPLELISSMNGRPCRTRDFELFESHEPESFFAKTPTVLISTENDTLLYVRGLLMSKVEGLTGFISPLPSSGTLEQYAIICKTNGWCSLVSTTRKSVIVQSEFQLDVPEDETIDWIDAIRYKDSTILFWGGTDSLRGQITWSFSTGIDTKLLSRESNLVFHEIKNSDDIYQDILKEALEEQDFSIHGNILTLWKQHKDHEQNNKRVWNKMNSLHVGHRELHYLNSANCIDVWGTPQQFVSLQDNYVKSWLLSMNGLEEVGKFQVPTDSKRLCVLFSHSR
jgi:hypothetical protein